MTNKNWLFSQSENNRLRQWFFFAFYLVSDGFLLS